MPFEGPMPQTRFVTEKALALDLPFVICVNKIDRPGARPDEVVDETLELLMDLNASDKQLDSRSFRLRKGRLCGKGSER
jgi:GTP-binding protein